MDVANHSSQVCDSKETFVTRPAKIEHVGTKCTSHNKPYHSGGIKYLHFVADKCLISA